MEQNNELKNEYLEEITVYNCETVSENKRKNHVNNEKKKILQTKKRHDLIVNLLKLLESYNSKVRATIKHWNNSKKNIYTLGERKLLIHYQKKEQEYQKEAEYMITWETLTDEELEYMQEIYRHLIRERSSINQILHKPRQQTTIRKHPMWDANSWYNSPVQEKIKRTKKQMTESEIYRSLGYEKKGKNWVLKPKSNY